MLAALENETFCCILESSRAKIGPTRNFFRPPVSRVLVWRRFESDPIADTGVVQQLFAISDSGDPPVCGRAVPHYGCVNAGLLDALLAELRRLAAPHLN
jgi:hypothetical protein